MRQENQDENVNDCSMSSGFESVGSSSDPSRLIVRLPAVSAQRNGPRKRLSKALSKAHRQLKSLKTDNANLKRKVKTIQRRFQRMKSKEAPLTPRRKTEKMMRDAGIQRNRSVRKHLLMSNVLIDEMKKKMKEKKAGNKRTVYGQVVGNLIKKYRCVSKISKETGVHRNLISRTIKEGVNLSKQRRSRALAKHRETVVRFLERKDNCRLQPGKNDSVKCGEERIQTRVLTDYLDNLYLKYRSEHPEIAISLSTFRRARPKYILPTTFLSRNTCLCTKHQNFRLQTKNDEERRHQSVCKPGGICSTEDLN
ncbi:hypothetical protein FSP39_009152 [Pinctada imbricata]|uniref:Uncharacterized protein n=1 Tax=Pinctada imbricata TaxID=66713 RepID=A0AA88Y5L2_PINIB|nr:hypothetical protein FSP39_009152 [Pinctada imbricata]